MVAVETEFNMLAADLPVVADYVAMFWVTAEDKLRPRLSGRVRECQHQKDFAIFRILRPGSSMTVQLFWFISAAGLGADSGTVCLAESAAISEASYP
jgi:hypothetical protein